MTTPPPPPPQDPYGTPQDPYGPPPGPYGPAQPSSQPQYNPYAQPGQPGQPAPGQPPYGYGQPGQPWGGPGFVPVPPRRKRTGLVVGIVVGALVVAGGIAFGVARVLDSAVEKGDLPTVGAFPEAKYRLTVPKTLLDDEYSLVKDSSATDGREIEDTYDPSIRNAKAVVAQYSSDDGGSLIVSGMWGRIKSPAFTREKILEGAVQNDGMTIAVPARDFRPEGYDVTVSCQVVRSVQGGVTSTLPMCAWGDDNTASFVAVVTPETAVQDPEKVDLDKAALDAARVRAEARRPIGGTAAG
ncbi:hypothetical protein ACWC1D_17390 [Streptomyces sp. NPDC001478]